MTAYVSDYVNARVTTKQLNRFGLVDILQLQTAEQPYREKVPLGCPLQLIYCLPRSTANRPCVCVTTLCVCVRVL